MTPEPAHTFGFVVPARNAARHLRTVLESIYAAAGDGAQIVVVDNGSTDGSPDIARACGATVVSRPGVRVGALRNHGARLVAAELVAFVDSDNELVPGWDAAAREALREPTVGAAGSLYQAPSSANWVQRMYDALRGRSRARQLVSWLGAGNLVVRRQVFLQVGGFDESLEACEDVDLCRRLGEAGWQIVSHPGMASVHHGDPRTLVDLFRGELWRGRDNIRVTLRGPLTLRGMASVVVPIAYLSSLLLLAASVVLARLMPAWLAPAAASMFGGLLIARWLAVVARSETMAPSDWLPALAVVGTYDLGRAGALLLGARHRSHRTES